MPSAPCEAGEPSVGDATAELLADAPQERLLLRAGGQWKGWLAAAVLRDVLGSDDGSRMLDILIGCSPGMEVSSLSRWCGWRRALPGWLPGASMKVSGMAAVLRSLGRSCCCCCCSCCSCCWCGETAVALLGERPAVLEGLPAALCCTY